MVHSLDTTAQHKKIAIKISGEALSGNGNSIHQMHALNKIASGILSVYEMGIKIVLIIGGGNIYRGHRNDIQNIDRLVIDQMGMLGTLINSIALQNILEKSGIPTRVQSAISVPYICEPLIIRKSLRHLEKNRIVIFASGTGNPYFSTDTAAVIRALEMRCDCLMKATKVAGVFLSDPNEDKNAEKISAISYDEIINKGLKIMDLSAISLAKENKLPIKVFSLKNIFNFKDALYKEGNFTLIS